MRCLRENADDVDRRLGNGIAAVDDAEGRLAACHQLQGGARVGHASDDNDTYARSFLLTAREVCSIYYI